ncbi:MAG: Mur ligase family protein [Bacteroidia bacterium]|nr:Mur ligase family protein [Bacteroidia bacterium]
MDYPEAVAYLYRRLPAYQRVGPAAYNRNLDRTLALLAALGNPHQGQRYLHVGGTNGKGSVCTLLAAATRALGEPRVGVYTSPHLIDLRERFQVNGQWMAADYLAQFVTRHQALIERVGPSFFELTVALALQWFKDEGCTLAVIEVGLGGRLDSTNVIAPELAIVTHVDYDHMDLLGDTLAQIAAEKAGIFKPGTPALVGRADAETLPVYQARAQAVGAPLHLATAYYHAAPAGPEGAWAVTARGPNPGGTDLSGPYQLDLLGGYQGENLATVLTALGLLEAQGRYRLDRSTVQAALAQSRTYYTLPGRMTVWPTDARIRLDMAHNAEGLRYALAHMAGLGYRHLHIVLGVVQEKDLGKLLPLLPTHATYYWVAPDLPRARSAADLATAAAAYGLVGNAYTNSLAGFAAAQAALQPTHGLLVTGSAFVVGEALASLQQ